MMRSRLWIQNTEAFTVLVCLARQIKDKEMWTGMGPNNQQSSDLWEDNQKNMAVCDAKNDKNIQNQLLLHELHPFLKVRKLQRQL